VLVEEARESYGGGSCWDINFATSNSRPLPKQVVSNVWDINSIVTIGWTYLDNPAMFIRISQ